MAKSEQLYINVEARVTELEKGMKRAQAISNKAYAGMKRDSRSAASQLENDMKRAVSRVNGTMKAFAGGLLGGLAAGGLAGIINQVGQVAKGVAAIGDEARRAGLSTKAFQELKYVAEQSRIPVDALVDGMKELSLRADEYIATGQGSAAESFRRLGYTATELKEKLKDPSALFTEIIGKLQQLDKAAQIRIADELFGGTGGEKFVQLIGQGEAGIKRMIQEANDFGVVMDDQMIRKAEELDKKFAAVAATVGTALKTAIVEAAGALQNFIDHFREVENRTTTSLESKLTELMTRRGQLQKQQGTLEDKALALIGRDAATELKAVDEEITKVSNELRTRSLPRLRQEINDANKAPTTFTAIPDPKSSKSGSSSSTALARAAQKATEDLNRAIANQTSVAVDAVSNMIGMNEKTASGSINAFLKAGGVDLNAATTAWCAAFVNSALAQVGVTGSGSQIATNFANWGVKVDPSQIQRGDVMVQMRGKQIGETGGHVGFATGQVRFQQGILQLQQISGNAANQVKEEWINASDTIVRRATEAMQLPADGLRNLSEQSQNAMRASEEALARQQQTAQQLGGIMQSAFDGLASALADGKLEGRELLQILMNVVQQLMQMQNFGGIGGGGGGLLGMLFGGFGGGKIAAGIPGPWGMSLHSGGVVGSGGTRRSVNPAWFANAPRMHSGGIAGLKHDEVAAVLQRGEVVLPRGFNAGGGGGNQTTIGSINIRVEDGKAQMDGGQRTELGQRLTAAVQQEIVRQQRPGGILAGTARR